VEQIFPNSSAPDVKEPGRWQFGAGIRALLVLHVQRADFRVIHQTYAVELCQVIAVQRLVESDSLKSRRWGNPEADARCKD
jgi:hypothetical protein